MVSVVACPSYSWAILTGRFVYILKNAAQPPRYYTGITSDVASRLLTHNDVVTPQGVGRGRWTL